MTTIDRRITDVQERCRTHDHGSLDKDLSWLVKQLEKQRKAMGVADKCLQEIGLDWTPDKDSLAGYYEDLASKTLTKIDEILKETE